MSNVFLYKISHSLVTIVSTVSRKTYYDSGCYHSYCHTKQDVKWSFSRMQIFLGFERRRGSKAGILSTFGLFHKLLNLYFMLVFQNIFFTSLLW